MLFDDEYVEQARRYPRVAGGQGTTFGPGESQGRDRLGEDGLPVHSFRTLLDDLATLAYNVCHTPLNPEARIVMTTRPRPFRKKPSAC